MTTPKPKPAAEASLLLEDKLDVTRAKSLLAALLERRGTPIVVDASAVQHIGAQCAQVLLSARRTWQEAGHEFRFAEPSEAFADGARLLGLTADFED